MMIELISKEEYIKLKERYKNKVVIVVPYGEKKVGVLKKKIKILKVKGIGYNFMNSSKYSNYEYFVVFCLDDISEKITEVEKKIKAMLDGDV